MNAEFSVDEGEEDAEVEKGEAVSERRDASFAVCLVLNACTSQSGIARSLSM